LFQQADARNGYGAADASTRFFRFNAGEKNPMNTLTVQPFLLMFMVGIAAMALPVYQVCRREVGTLRIDAFKVKASAWRSAYRRVVNAWRAMFADMLPTLAIMLVIAAIAHATNAHAAGAPMMGIALIHTRVQERAELKAKALALLAKTERAEAEEAELTGIETRVSALDKDIALLAKLQEDERNAAGAHVQFGQNRAESKPWGPTLHSDATDSMKKAARQAALGEFAIAIKAAASGEGMDPRLFAAGTGMNTVNGSDGGFAVPPELAPGLEQGMFAGGEILSRVDARTITGDSISYNVVDETSRVAGSRAGSVQGYWVDQGTAPTASSVKLARIELKLRKVATLGYMTDELVSDAAALGGELESSFVDELIFQVEDAIVEGTGAGQPLGYQNAPCLVTVAKETGQAAATIAVANLSKMWARLPARSKANAVWLINVDTEPQLDLLTIPAGTGAVEPRFVTYAPDGTLNIKGRPVVRVEYCATLGTLGDIALVDLTRYRLIRKGSGPETASSMHVRFTQGEQTFKATYRVDGQPVPRSAITPFKGTNTLSPFVVLATR
jgi:HK97 family phage major capsid protein